jgi:hypothetical protein
MSAARSRPMRSQKVIAARTLANRAAADADAMVGLAADN